MTADLLGELLRNAGDSDAATEPDSLSNGAT